MTSNVLQDFLSANRQYCSKIPSAPSEGAGNVLVDCLVMHPGYVLGNLYLGRYYQSQHGGDLFTYCHNRNQTLMAIAQSFGATRSFFEADLVQQVNRPAATEARRILAEIENPGLTFEERRRALLAQKIKGIQVGDLIYDTYLAQSHKTTVDEITEELRTVIILCCRYYFVYIALLKQNNISAVVLGHIVYLRFGVLARLAVANGVQVIAKKPASNNVLIRTCHSQADLYRHELKFARDEFDTLYASVGSELIEAGRDVASGSLVPKDDLTGAHAADNGEKPEVRKVFDELSAEKPCVAVFAHCFTDAVHSHPALIYDDFHIWLDETLKIAAGMPEINWVVKGHPHAVHYKELRSAADVVQPYLASAPNIKLLPDAVGFGDISHRISAAVTAAGTVCVEGGICGIPVVSAGDGVWSGLGFDHRAESVSEYRDLLRNAPTLTAPTADSSKRALAALGLVNRYARVTSAVLPEISDQFWVRRDAETLFAETASRLKTTEPAQDPFFQAIKYGAQRQCSFLKAADSAQTPDELALASAD